MVQQRLFGIFAYPVHHSLSPLMHNAAFHQLGLPYHYQPFDIPPNKLGEAVESLRVLHIGGINVTIPHKEKIIPFLDELDPEAEVIGAVNTVVRQENGSLKGYNTDGAGYVRSLLESTGITLGERKALILGAGGAAKGIAIYLMKFGCGSLTLTNRTEQNTKQLHLQLKEYSETNKIDCQLHTVALDQAEQHLDRYDLIINTTPVGMWPQIDRVPISLDQLSSQSIVSDIVYNPLKTEWLKEAERRGAVIHEGLGMFIYQGALAFELFTGKAAPVDRMKEVVLERLLRAQS